MLAINTKLIIFAQLYFVTFSAKCPNSQYAKCDDILQENECTGNIGGRQCFLRNNACGFKTCEDLTADQCTAQILESAQCFKDKNGVCKSAYICEQYDSEIACTNVSKVSCVWVTATLTNPATCKTTACSDLTDPKKCLSTFIGTNLCTWWGATYSCEIADCSFIEKEYCDQTKANGVPCKWSGSECREQRCSDLESSQCAAKFDLSKTTSCILQATRTGKICTSVTQCEDIISSANCETLSNGTECIWDTIVCRKKRCSDFSSSQCTADQGCFWETTCKSCSQLIIACDCIATTACYWKQISEGYQCAIKECSSAKSKEQCELFACYWNTQTLACGKTLADTVPTINDGSELLEQTNSNTNTNSNNIKNQSSESRFQIFLFFFALISFLHLF